MCRHSTYSSVDLFLEHGTEESSGRSCRLQAGGSQSRKAIRWETNNRSQKKKKVQGCTIEKTKTKNNMECQTRTWEEREEDKGGKKFEEKKKYR